MPRNFLSEIFRISDAFFASGNSKFEMKWIKRKSPLVERLDENDVDGIYTDCSIWEQHSYYQDAILGYIGFFIVKYILKDLT